ncbi:hypothetical protein DL93DRAFT_132664 [Clavulina sp. PMI_390]|nr:hypothetical protein DL93DRAFT_132664 [Clavulina sp. PMI_390]
MRRSGYRDGYLGSFRRGQLRHHPFNLTQERLPSTTMDNPDAPHTDVVAAVLLRALLASGDIDEAHATTSSFTNLITRWMAIHDRFAAKKYKLTTAQRKKVAAWLRVGLVDVLISELETLRPHTEL